MSSNTNIGNTPVNQGYVQLIHTGETGGIDGTLRTLYDGDGTASDLQIASNAVKISTQLYIGSKTITEYVQDVVGDMFTTGSYTNITTTYDDTNGNIDLSASGEVTLTGTQTLTNKTLASPTFTGTANGANLTLTGDLTVSGDTIFTNSNNVLIGDAILTLNADETGSPTANAGFEVERGTSTNKSFVWNETDDKWTIGSETFVAGTVEANLTGNVTGNVTGSASLNLLISNNLSDLASAATARTNLGVAIGTNVQAYDAGLQSISGLTTAADKMIYTTASDTYAVTDLTSTARTLLDDTSIGAMRTTLGLGVLATADTVLFDRIDGTAYITSAEAFSDSDLQLMTAAAIDDLIISKGYGTGTMSSWTLEGDSGSTTVTNANTVDIAGGTGITTVASLDAGRDTVTINFSAGIDDLSDVQITSVSNGQVLKYSSAESAFVNQDEDTGISFNGSTANGLLTFGNSTTADVESNLTFDASSNLNLLSDSGKLRIGADSELEIYHNGTNDIIESGGTAMLFKQGTAEKIKFNSAGNIQFNNSQADINTRFATTGSTFTLFIDGGTDRVGIGTNSPETNLHIGSGTQSVAALAGVGIANGASAYSFFSASDGTKQYIAGIDNTLTYSKAGTLSNHDHAIITNNVERIYINSSGNVGIGGTPVNFTNYVNLDVKTNASGGGVIGFHDSGGTRVGCISHTESLNTFAVEAFNSHPMTFLTNNTEAMRIDSSQNVGIGTNSPAHKLDVNGGIRNYANGSAVLRTESTAAGYGAYNKLITTTNTYDLYALNGDFIIDESGVAERFRIQDTTGNVGIGETNPSQKLHIDGNICRLDKVGNDGGYYIYNSSDSFRAAFFDNNSQTRLYADGDGSNAAMVFDGGNVGIGTTSPQSELNVKSDTNSLAQETLSLSPSTTNSSQGGLGVQSGGLISLIGNNRISMYTGGGVGDTEAVRIDSSQDAHFDQDVIAFSTTPSDIRLKENFEKIENGLDIVSQLEGHTFNWKKGGERLSAGFKAQEVEKILPHLVDEKKLPLRADDDKEYKILRYEEMIPYLVEAIKEQQKQIEELKNG